MELWATGKGNISGCHAVILMGVVIKIRNEKLTWCMRAHTDSPPGTSELEMQL